MAEHLRKVAPAAYCNICVASVLGLEHSQVFKATAQLGVHHDFRVLVGARCAGCDRIRITTGVKARETRRPAG